MDDSGTTAKTIVLSNERMTTMLMKQVTADLLSRPSTYTTYAIIKGEGNEKVHNDYRYSVFVRNSMRVFLARQIGSMLSSSQPLKQERMPRK